MAIDPDGLRASHVEVSSRPRHDPAGEKFFCRVPFASAFVTPTGEVWPGCCPGWVDFPMGSLLTDSWDEIWNGKQAQALRQSMHDGSLRHCDENWCPHIQNARAGHDDDCVVRHEDRARLGLPAAELDGTLVLTHGPAEVGMHYDWSCNLACPTCRSEIRTAHGTEETMLRLLHDEVTAKLLPDAETIVMTGSGDPFASPLCREFLVGLRPGDYPNLRSVALITNAIMLTPTMWERMPGLHDLDVSIDISIDAATAATYHDVRRPARWDRLMENLDFIVGIPNLSSLGISMTVSSRNAHEVTAFLDFARGLTTRVAAPAMNVEFKRVRRWGHSDDEWRSISLETLGPSERADLIRQVRAVEAQRGQHARPLRRFGRRRPLGAPLTVRSNLSELLDTSDWGSPRTWSRDGADAPRSRPDNAVSVPAPARSLNAGHHRMLAECRSELLRGLWAGATRDRAQQRPGRLGDLPAVGRLRPGTAGRAEGGATGAADLQWADREPGDRKCHTACGQGPPRPADRWAPAAGPRDLPVGGHWQRHSATGPVRSIPDAVSRLTSPDGNANSRASLQRCGRRS